MLSRVASKRTAHSKQPTHGLPPSYPPPTSPPTDPLPTQQSRPSDVLLSRLHELKRLIKSLSSHFTALASAEASYGKSLKGVSESEKGKGVRGEWLQGGLFLPPTGNARGGGGWAEWCGKVREETGKEAEAHLRLARLAEEEVIDPLHRLYLGIKAFIADLDESVNPLAEEVLKEREASTAAITHLSTSLASFTSDPLSLPASEDPLIVRSTAELQVRKQVDRENELLRIVLAWQEKTRAFEREAMVRAGSCWKWWAEESAKVHLDARQSLVKLTRQNEDIAPGAEWHHFLTLNHLLPPTTTFRSQDLIDYPHRDDAATKPLKEGVMERKKKWTREWKGCFFVLTSAGYLHEYRSPTTPLSTPHLSLFLPACTVHPLQPAKVSALAKGGKEKPAEFVIEGRKADPATGGGTVKGKVGIKPREAVRVYRARSETEAAAWWSEIEKLSKTSFTARPGGASATGDAATSLFHRQGPAPTAVQQAGLPAVVEHGEQTADEDDGEGAGLSSAEEESREPGGGLKRGEAVVGAAGVVGVAGEEEVKDEGKGRDMSAAEKLDGERKESMSAPPSATEPTFPGTFVIEELEKKAEIAQPASTDPGILPAGTGVAQPSSLPAVVQDRTLGPTQHPALAQQPPQQQEPSLHPMTAAVKDVSAIRPPAEIVEPTAVHPVPSAVHPVSSTAAAPPPDLPPRQSATISSATPAGETTSRLHPAPGPGTVEPADNTMVDSSSPSAPFGGGRDVGGAHPPPATTDSTVQILPTPVAREKKRRGSWFGLRR
ncbi:hypothetical protein JCM11251_001556 [Rhodosporidiobolus azoricus]